MHITPLYAAGVSVESSARFIALKQQSNNHQMPYKVEEELLPSNHPYKIACIRNKTPKTADCYKESKHAQKIPVMMITDSLPNDTP